MKQIIYYISVSTLTFIFLGCTSIKNIIHPPQVLQSTQKHSSKQVSKKIKKSKKATKSKKISKKKKSTKSKKKSVKLIEPSSSKKTVKSQTVSIKKASKKAPIDAYGKSPKKYRSSIKKYLAKDVRSHESIKYVFSRPKKVEKKDHSWKGWMVEVDMLKRDGKGKLLKKKPYNILFNGSSIKEDISKSKIIY